MNSFLVLIVEDDDNLREAIKETLSLENIVSVTARNGKEALVLLNSRSVDLILSDIQMPELDGIGLLKAVSQKFFRLPIVLMTAYGDIQNAVEAMRLGAADYLVKPFEIKALLDLINQFSVYATSTDPMVASPNSIDLLNRAKHVAKNDATVMITGESGTGKEVLARYIHQYSSRAQKDFVAINCAAIPENMLEAVLFGYEKGAFTGAYQTTPGKFELANGGTILLDEFDTAGKIIASIARKRNRSFGSEKNNPNRCKSDCDI